MPLPAGHLVSLGFATVQLLRPDVAEVSIAHGIEFDGAMVDRLYDWLRQHTPPERRLLINKANDYSYSFEAQHKLVQQSDVEQIAVLVRHQQSRDAIEMLRELAPRPVKLQVFMERADALRWLGLEG
jgi:hypothetical protein